MSDRRRLVALGGSMLIALSAGSTYVFSSYAPQLQTVLQLTSTQLNILGLAGNLGMYLSGPMWGAWVDRKGPHNGQWPLTCSVIIVGGILAAGGYAFLALSYHFQWQTIPLALLAVALLMTGMGNSAGNNAALNVQARNWGGDRRGTAMAATLAAFGLSAFLYSTVSHVFFNGNVAGYLLALAIGTFTCFTVGVALVRIIPATHSGRSSGLERTEYERVLDSAVADEVAEEPTPRPRRSRSSSEVSGRAYAWVDDSLHPRAFHDPDVGDLYDEPSAHEAPGLSGWALVQNTDFLLLFTVLGLVSGAGLLLINNVGLMTRVLWDSSSRGEEKSLAALSGTWSARLVGAADVGVQKHAQSEEDVVQRLQAVQVSCISLGNAFGRILIGALRMFSALTPGVMSDFFVRATDEPSSRTLFLALVTLLAIVSQGLAAWPNAIVNVDRLLFVSALTGLMYGTLFGLCPVLAFEWFGERTFSQNWGWISLAPVVGGNVYNLLFGYIYDAHVPPDSRSHRCLEGDACYRGVFVVTTIGCVVAFGVSLVLITRRITDFAPRISRAWSATITAVKAPVRL
ncbi:hypothetical protein MSPP1_003581 [Malassezia sp. CBS 17886]|nr:hypothetical protein MSPP1_003581 [Malassezia sp. CBS 17886]